MSSILRLARQLCLIAAIFIPASGLSAENSSLKWYTQLEEAQEAAKESGKPLMIDLWAQWCAPCKKLAKETFTDPLVVPLLDGFILAKIDVMEEAHQALSAESLPKVYFAKADGVELPDHTLNKFEKGPPFAERLKKARVAVGLPAIGTPAAAGSPEETGETEKKKEKVPPVRAAWVKSHDTVAPGDSVLLGLELSLEKGWHVYWRYPSPTELGEPIKITWSEKLPFEVDSIQWPAPVEFLDFGEFTTFGYKDAVTLILPIDIPEDAKSGATLEAEATVDWLVCNEGNCIPASVKLPLTWDVSTSARNDNATANIEGWQAKVAPSSLEGLAVTTTPIQALPGDGFQAEFIVKATGEGATLSTAKEDKYKKPVIPFTDRAVQIKDRQISKQDDGSLKITLGGSVTESAEKGGKVPLGAVLRFQTNGEDTLLQVETTLELSASSASGGAPGQDVALWQMLLFALIGGLLLNIMPCVLPVLSIKAMGLVNQAGEDDTAIWHHGLAYGFGVILSFLALAGFVVALKMSGDLVGWGFQFQNPVFVAVLTAMIFGFALSLFGVYEITAPGMQTAHKASSKGGLTGSFANGAFATLLATPCTAPFLGPAMGFAFSQSPAIIFLMFATVGLGLALPFVLLARFPAWIKRIPKPGPWMEHFKHTMGFLLIATVVWLLDVLAHMVTPRSMTGILAFLAAISLAAWAYGKFAGFTASRKQQWVVTVLALGLLFLGGQQGLTLKELGAEGAAGVEMAEGWENFSEDRVDSLQADGKTIFIDFTAKWCITCKANEEGVLETDTIRSEMERLGVVPMVADNTRKDPVINKWLRRFNRSGVPLYVVLSGDKSKDPIVLPEILTEGIVMDALKEAGPSL